MAKYGSRRKHKDDRPNQNMGRVQKAEPYWGTWGSSKDGDDPRKRGAEQHDREQREAYGKPLPAAYRYILGPTPKLHPSDFVGALVYLRKIYEAVELGGWTRSEWTRLRALRTKWVARAKGRDARFKEVGNRTGGVNKVEAAHIRQRRLVEEMRVELESGKSKGD